jgi:3-hydroxyacyl-[acyl-carrier-protein] dehydratase
MTLTTTITVDPSEPVLAGHYPGFPILPGLILLEHVNDLVREATGDPALRLLAAEKIRFLSPVRPGDTVRIEAALNAGECIATAAVGDRVAAQFTLRYPEGDRR